MTPERRASPQEVNAFLSAHAGWRLEQGEIRRTFEFHSFKEAVAFVNEVAEVAERNNYHPDIDIRFRHVTVSFITYKIDAVTTRDFEVASQVDALRPHHRSKSAPAPKDT